MFLGSVSIDLGYMRASIQKLDNFLKENMKEALKAIEDGRFAEKWIAEFKNGCPNLLARRAALAEHPVEKVGTEIRALFEQG